MGVDLGSRGWSRSKGESKRERERVYEGSRWSNRRLQRGVRRWNDEDVGPGYVGLDWIKTEGSASGVGPSEGLGGFRNERVGGGMLFNPLEAVRYVRFSRWTKPLETDGRF